MSWTLTLSVPKPPKAQIVKDWEKYGIAINGRYVPPGSYTVQKGTKITYSAKAENKGGSGEIWIRLMANGQLVKMAKGTSVVSLSGSLVVNSKAELKFEAGHGTTVDDEWGC